MTFQRALRWLARDASTLHASAIDLQFSSDGFGLIVGSIAPICIATRALLAANPGSVPSSHVIAHLREHASDQGWRYFNHHPPIPPDSDDLALVLHVLAAAGLSASLPWVDAPLQLLDKNRLSPGLFPTWLVANPTRRTAADQAWASGVHPVHPEVVANLAHALLAIDAHRWSDDILAAATWLAAEPSVRLNGNHWYYGMGYAGWLICNFLSAAHSAGVVDATNGLSAYRELLAEGQNDRGAWPMDRPPRARLGLGRPPMSVLQASVLETAWRMAALRCTGASLAQPMLAAAGDFLVAAQAADGGFAAEAFFETLSVAPYGSRTVTTSAVLHALAPEP
jgi:hypothetical protein